MSKRCIYEIKDYTEEFIDMIEAFECDFNILLEENKNSEELILKLPRSERLIKDIDLLQKLSFNLRHDIYKIIGGFRND